VVDEVAGAKATFPENSITSDYALAAIPARYLLERGGWSEAKTLAVRPAPSWRGMEALTHFARGLGAARSGDSALARVEIDTLQSLEGELAKIPTQVYWTTQVRIQRLAVSAWLLRLRGDTAAAIEAARAAADLEDAFHVERNQGFAQRRSRDAELLREIAFSRQPNPGAQTAFLDQFANLVGDLLVEASRFDRLERNGHDGGHR